MNDFGTSSPEVGGLLALAGIFTGVGLLLAVVILISMWKIFVKAGRPGWEGIIPIYNFYILITEILKKPMSWFWIIVAGIVLSIIPFVNIIASLGLLAFSFIINIELAKAFGKNTIFGVLMTFFSVILYPVLAFGSAEYIPPTDQSDAKLSESINL